MGQLIVPGVDLKHTDCFHCARDQATTWQRLNNTVDSDQATTWL